MMHHEAFGRRAVARRDRRDDLEMLAQSGQAVHETRGQRQPSDPDHHAQPAERLVDHAVSQMRESDLVHQIVHQAARARQLPDLLARFRLARHDLERSHPDPVDPRQIARLRIAPGRDRLDELAEPVDVVGLPLGRFAHHDAALRDEADDPLEPFMETMTLNGQDVASTYLEVLKLSGNSGYMKYRTVPPQIGDKLDKAIENVVIGQMSHADAMAAAQEEAVADLKKLGIEIDL